MPNKPGSKYHLERPRVRARVIRLLADGRHSQQAIARYFDVDPSSMSLFKQRHREEIEAIRRGILEKTDHLWITHKANQLAAMDQMYADLQDFKVNRMVQQVTNNLTQPAPTQLPVSSAGDVSKTHGYEVIEVKQVGREVIEVRKFDKGLFDAELAVMERASKMMGLEPKLGDQSPTLVQNNFNFTDRSNAVALARQFRQLAEKAIDPEP